MTDLNEIQKAEDNLSRKLENDRKALFESDDKSLKKREKKLRFFVYLQIAIILISVFIIYSYYPQFLSSSQRGTVLRYGTYMTDKDTDQCLKNIWLLINDRKASVRCPVSGRPYVIQGRTISCPDPEKHGFRRIFSENGKIPRIE